MMRVLFWLVIAAAYFVVIVLICKCISVARRKYERFARPTDGSEWADGATIGVAELPDSAPEPVGPVYIEATQARRS
jgi:hypothetical protein